MKTALFLCTGNYYRSRFAEELFNRHTTVSGLGWRALSRALAIDRGIGNVGPVSGHTVDGLAARGIQAEGQASARIVAVCLIDLRLQHRSHVPGLNADHRQARFGESAEQPLR